MCVLVRQVSSSSTHQCAKQVDLHVACLCNLAFACIKLGFLEEAEEACSRALHITPSSSKALFRRGQARLDSGRPAEAASDFRAVAILEPTNVEVQNVLRCVVPHHSGADVVTDEQLADCDVLSSKVCPSSCNAERDLTMRGGGDRTCAENNGTRTGVNSGGTGETIAEATATTNGTQEAHPTGSGSTETSCEGREDIDEQKYKAVRTADTPPGRSGFMVPGWLGSKERASAAEQQGRQQLQQSDNHSLAQASPITTRERFGIHQLDGGGTSSHDGTDVNLGDTSRLVAKLAARNAAKRRGHNVNNAGTISEWSRLQEEEVQRIQGVVQQRVGGSQPKRETRKDISGPSIGSRRGVADQNKRVDTLMNGNKQVLGAKTLQVCEWASLEEQEKRVRDAFRASLGIGKKTKKKRPVSRVQAVPSAEDG